MQPRQLAPDFSGANSPPSRGAIAVSEHTNATRYVTVPNAAGADNGMVTMMGRLDTSIQRTEERNAAHFAQMFDGIDRLVGAVELADMFTKALPPGDFKRLRDRILLRSHPTN